MPAMQLYEPISTLKPVAEDLWIVDGPIVRMAFGWLKVPFPTRTSPPSATTSPSR